MGDALYEKYRVPVAVAACAAGGTIAKEWLPNTDLYNYLLLRIKQFGPGGFRAVLWHQGESELETPADTYYNQMKTIIRSSCEDAGWYFPWFTAKATRLSQDLPYHKEIRDAQQKLVDDKISLAGPDTDTLGENYRDYTGAHFNREGLKKHGEMWAKCVEKYLDQIYK